MQKAILSFVIDVFLKKFNIICPFFPSPASFDFYEEKEWRKKNRKKIKKDIDSSENMSIFAFVLSALVAELVDAADSKSVVLTDVLVRFRPGAPLFNKKHLSRCFCRINQDSRCNLTCSLRKKCQIK